MKYVMPLKAVISRQIELVIKKALEWYTEDKITDSSYFKCGYYDIAHDLELILGNIDLIEFKKSKYEGVVKRIKKSEKKITYWDWKKKEQCEK